MDFIPRVRELAFGAEVQFEEYLGYVAASFIGHDYPHRDEATYVSFGRPGRQISRYAMRQDQSAFLFVFAERTNPLLQVTTVQRKRRPSLEVRRRRLGA